MIKIDKSGYCSQYYKPFQAYMPDPKSSIFYKILSYFTFNEQKTFQLVSRVWRDAIELQPKTLGGVNLKDYKIIYSNVKNSEEAECNIIGEFHTPQYDITNGRIIKGLKKIDLTIFVESFPSMKKVPSQIERNLRLDEKEITDKELIELGKFLEKNNLFIGIPYEMPTILQYMREQEYFKYIVRGTSKESLFFKWGLDAEIGNKFNIVGWDYPFTVIEHLELDKKVKELHESIKKFQIENNKMGLCKALIEQNEVLGSIMRQRTEYMGKTLSEAFGLEKKQISENKEKENKKFILFCGVQHLIKKWGGDERWDLDAFYEIIFRMAKAGNKIFIAAPREHINNIEKEKIKMHMIKQYENMKKK